jgi:hypothetical protein
VSIQTKIGFIISFVSYLHIFYRKHQTLLFEIKVCPLNSNISDLLLVFYSHCGTISYKKKTICISCKCSTIS